MILLSASLGFIFLGMFIGTYVHNRIKEYWAFKLGAVLFLSGCSFLVATVFLGFGGKLVYLFDGVWNFITSQIQQLRAW